MTSSRDSVAVSRLTEEPEGERSARLLAELPRDRRLAGLGVVAALGSLFLPWYAPAVGVEVVKTGLSDAGFAQLALGLTLASSLFLILRAQRGYRLPRPLHEGTLLALAGAWSALIFVYLTVDRPDFDFLSSEIVRLRFGIFVGIGGAVAMVVAGLRLRTAELARERVERARRGEPQ
jgi:hypothetical protein